jgi:hypothetical protein
VHDAVESFAKDFGYDLDEEGQALDDETPERTSRSDGENQPADEGQDQPVEEPQAA